MTATSSPRNSRLLSDRALAIATAVMFCVSTVFPLTAAVYPNAEGRNCYSACSAQAQATCPGASGTHPTHLPGVIT